MFSNWLINHLAINYKVIMYSIVQFCYLISNIQLKVEVLHTIKFKREQLPILPANLIFPSKCA